MGNPYWDASWHAQLGMVNLACYKVHGLLDSCTLISLLTRQLAHMHLEQILGMVCLSTQHVCCMTHSIQRIHAACMSMLNLRSVASYNMSNLDMNNLDMSNC